MGLKEFLYEGCRWDFYLFFYFFIKGTAGGKSDISIFHDHKFSFQTSSGFLTRDLRFLVLRKSRNPPFTIGPPACGWVYVGFNLFAFGYLR